MVLKIRIRDVGIRHHGTRCCPASIHWRWKERRKSRNVGICSLRNVTWEGLWHRGRWLWHEEWKATPLRSRTGIRLDINHAEHVIIDARWHRTGCQRWISTIDLGTADRWHVWSERSWHNIGFGSDGLTRSESHYSGH